MYSRWFIIFVTICLYFQQTKSEIRPVLINQFNVPHANSVKPIRSLTNSTSWTLMITSYNIIPTATDYIYTVSNIEQKLTANITPVVVTDQINWPNGVIAADSIAPQSLIVPSGFIIPGKTLGNIYYLDKTNRPIALVPDEKTSWYYHSADFTDVDQDGFIDIVTGRANFPLLHTPHTELIWLKNPGGMNITGPWNMSILLPQGGPEMDVQFATVDGKHVLFSNSLLTRGLQMFWSLAEPYWNDPEQIRVRHIDSYLLQYAHVQYTIDLNGEQRRDLIATISNDFDGLIVAYELPPSGHLFDGFFEKHILAGGFKPTVQALGREAPGRSIPYQIISSAQRKKPIIVISGADDGCVYVLEAVRDNDPKDWQYYMTTVYNSTGLTIGDISIEDVDNDGHPELFIPATSEGRVLIYRLMDN